MKVLNISQNPKLYTCNVYFVLGSFNYLKNKNTLIDVGRDESILKLIEETPTGVGKHKIDQVILTHSHYDHTSLLPIIKEKYKPIIYAFCPHLKGVDVLLKDGDNLLIGDKECRIIHTPGHSNDSICIYCEEEKFLFSGDTDFLHLSANKSYEETFIQALKKLSNKSTQIIFPGHGPPYNSNVTELISAYFNELNPN